MNPDIGEVNIFLNRSSPDRQAKQGPYHEDLATRGVWDDRTQTYRTLAMNYANVLKAFKDQGDDLIRPTPFKNTSGNGMRAVS